MKKIMANIWGNQKEVNLCTWKEINALGFQVQERLFGTLNDGTQALFFCRYENGQRDYTWYVTTEKLDDLK